jgi:hypothetical protein
MPAAPIGHGQAHAGQAVTVGGDADQRRLGAVGDVQVDAVQVEARLLGADGEARLVDQPLQVGDGQREAVRQRILGHHREILARQAGQHEARASRAQRQPLVGAAVLQFDLRALGQLADDVVERVGGGGDRAGGGDVRRHGLHHRQVEVGRRQVEAAVRRLEQHVRQDRYGGAPLDNALHVPQRPQERRAFNGEFHGL